MRTSRIIKHLTAFVWASTIGVAPAAWAGDLIEPDVSRLRLLAQAHSNADAVRLSDVLNFAEADPRLQAELGEKELVSKPLGAVVEISHEQVVSRLQALGLNLSRVVINGALSCKVQIDQPIAKAADGTQSVANPDESLLRPGSGTASLSLADILRERINRTKPASGQFEVEFERAGQQFLELTTPPWDFEISGGGQNRLGLREFTITLLRDGRVQRTIHIGASVRMSMPVLVASRPLSVGAFIRRDDVRLEQRTFTHDGEDFLESIDAAVGLQLKRFVEPGTQIAKADLRAVDLVQRSRPVTICGGSSVQISMTGVALDSGTLGETVRVRIGDDRSTRREVRGVVTGVGTVRMLEGERE